MLKCRTCPLSEACLLAEILSTIFEPEPKPVAIIVDVAQAARQGLSLMGALDAALDLALELPRGLDDQIPLIEFDFSKRVVATARRRPLEVNLDECAMGVGFLVR